MGVVEGTSYGALILAGLAFAGKWTSGLPSLLAKWPKEHRREVLLPCFLPKNEGTGLHPVAVSLQPPLSWRSAKENGSGALTALSFLAAAVIWAVVNELLIQPMEYTCFNLTLKKLQDDPRVTVRLGTPVSGYGQDSRNRQARQRIPHRVYKDASGREKIQVCPRLQAWRQSNNGEANVVKEGIFDPS